MKEIVKDVLGKYLATINDSSVLLFGSALTEEWMEESDIDLFLISESDADETLHLEINGILLEIQQDNFERILENIENERGNLHNRNLSTMIATAQILKTSDNARLEILKEKAKEILNSPTKYTNEDEKMWRYSIDDYLSKCRKDLKRDDATAFQLDSTYVIQNLLDLFLAKHNSYLTQPKHLAELLRQFDNDFADNFEKFSRASSLDEKMKYLAELYETIK